MKKTLKRLFAGNLGQRLDQNIQPQTDAFNDLLERVAGNLGAETPLSRQIEEAEKELDMLKDRETLDRTEVGLFHSMEREWISEKDYIVAQRYLVHQLDALNGGNLYKKREVVVEPVDTGEIVVQAESV